MTRETQSKATQLRGGPQSRQGRGWALKTSSPGKQSKEGCCRLQVNQEGGRRTGVDGENSWLQCTPSGKEALAEGGVVGTARYLTELGLAVRWRPGQ